MSIILTTEMNHLAPALTQRSNRCQQQRCWAPAPAHRRRPP